MTLTGLLYGVEFITGVQSEGRFPAGLSKLALR